MHHYFPKSSFEGASKRETDLNSQINKEVYRPYWENDHEREACHVITCLKTFSKFRGIGERRHHCRKCGKLVCNACSKTRRRLPELGYSQPVRICLMCVDEMDLQREAGSASKS